MDEWVHFEKGAYLAKRAFLAAPDGKAVGLDDAVIEVYQGRGGIRQVKGRGFVPNVLVVELLEDNDTLDLIVDLSGAYKFCIEDPELVAGKVFSPGVRSVLQFIPKKPWRQLTADAFNRLLEQLTFL